MAAPGEYAGFGTPGYMNQNHINNITETDLLEGPSANTVSPSLEDMLKEATDLQTGRTFNGTRLELRSDETTSPFQAPPPSIQPQPMLNSLPPPTQTQTQSYSAGIHKFTAVE